MLVAPWCSSTSAGILSRLFRFPVPSDRENPSLVESASRRDAPLVPAPAWEPLPNLKPAAQGFFRKGSALGWQEELSSSLRLALYEASARLFAKLRGKGNFLRRPGRAFKRGCSARSS